MEEIAFSRDPSSAAARPATEETTAQVPWRDLREWIMRVDERGLLKRISAPVDPDEELSAITFMTTRGETAPALMFETLKSGEPGMRVLANMLGSSAAPHAGAK